MIMTAFVISLVGLGISLTSLVLTIRDRTEEVEY